MHLFRSSEVNRLRRQRDDAEASEALALSRVRILEAQIAALTPKRGAGGRFERNA